METLVAVDGVILVAVVVVDSEGLMMVPQLFIFHYSVWSSNFLDIMII